YMSVVSDLLASAWSCQLTTISARCRWCFPTLKMTCALVAPLSTVSSFLKCSVTCFRMAGETEKLRPVNSIFIPILLSLAPDRGADNRARLWLVEATQNG